MGGYPDHTFHPEDQITRAESVTTLVKFLGIEVSDKLRATSFSDVYIGDWYMPYVESGKGLFPPRLAFDGSMPFLPNYPMLREDLAYAIVVALGYQSQIKIVDQSILNMFSDRDSISADTKAYVAFAVSENLVSGFSDGTFRGQNPLTRAEFAAMMARALKHGRNPELDPKLSPIYIRGDIVPTYNSAVKLIRYAGSGERDHIDNADPLEAGLVNPSSITMDDATGDIYVADSGKLKKIDDSGVTTYNIDPSYIEPYKIECYNGDLYFVSNPFRNESGTAMYVVVRMNELGIEAIYGTEIGGSDLIADMTIDNGIMYVLQYYQGYEKNYISTIDLNTNEYYMLKGVDEGFKTIDVSDGYIYLGNSDKSYIGRVALDSIQNNEVEAYCGSIDDGRIIDGMDMRFFMPRSLMCHDGYMYVMDFNMLRRFELKATNLNLSSETIAGVFTSEKNPAVDRAQYLTDSWHDAMDALFAPSAEIDFCFDKNGDILLTDPRKSVIWKIRLQ